jgi:hypothetical protein
VAAISPGVYSGSGQTVIGRRLAHYEILSKLGEGGMGVVYKARDTHLDRYVAIKLLPPEFVADPERKRRFIQEAKAASALNHPGIITIYDITQAGGIDFIAMEYVQGKTLGELLGRKGLRLKDTLSYASQAASALDAERRTTGPRGPFAAHHDKHWGFRDRLARTDRASLQRDCNGSQTTARRTSLNRRVTPPRGPTAPAEACGRIIIPLTVREILDEQIARKLA